MIWREVFFNGGRAELPPARAKVFRRSCRRRPGTPQLRTTFPACLDFLGGRGFFSSLSRARQPLGSGRAKPNPPPPPQPLAPAPSQPTLTSARLRLRLARRGSCSAGPWHRQPEPAWRGRLSSPPPPASPHSSAGERPCHAAEFQSGVAQWAEAGRPAAAPGRGKERSAAEGERRAKRRAVLGRGGQPPRPLAPRGGRLIGAGLTKPRPA